MKIKLIIMYDIYYNKYNTIHCMYNASYILWKYSLGYYYCYLVLLFIIDLYYLFLVIIYYQYNQYLLNFEWYNLIKFIIINYSIYVSQLSLSDKNTFT